MPDQEHMDECQTDRGRKRRGANSTEEGKVMILAPE
jgi:hypothetical protein